MKLKHYAIVIATTTAFALLGFWALNRFGITSKVVKAALTPKGGI